MPELTEERYRKLKRIVEDAKAEAERAQGERNELVRQLKENFGCSTPREATRKLAQLIEERDRRQEKFNNALRQYEKKWS